MLSHSPDTEIPSQQIEAIDAAFAMIALEQIDQKLNHVSMLEQGIPAASEPRALQARWRFLKLAGESCALVAAGIQMRTQALNFEVPNHAFQWPKLLNEEYAQKW